MIASGANDFIWWEWVSRESSLNKISSAAREHLVMTAITMAGGVVIAAVLSGIALHLPRLQRWIEGTATVIYTIPSLALFGFLIPITGLSLLTAEIALVGYTLQSLVTSMIAGYRSVPAHVIEAAEAMGMGRFKRFVSVETPLAASKLIAGLRIATVGTVGLVTIAALIGQGGGFGGLILEGRRLQNFSTMIVIGIAGSVTLAMLFDVILLGIGRVVTRWERR